MLNQLKSLGMTRDPQLVEVWNPYNPSRSLKRPQVGGCCPHDTHSCQSTAGRHGWTRDTHEWDTTLSNSGRLHPRSWSLPRCSPHGAMVGHDGKCKRYQQSTCDVTDIVHPWTQGDRSRARLHMRGFGWQIGPIREYDEGTMERPLLGTIIALVSVKRWKSNKKTHQHCPYSLEKWCWNRC